MRFYSVSVPEVMVLTLRQLYYLGERIRIYKTEDLLDQILVSSYPHMKADKQKEISRQLHAIIGEDKRSGGEDRILEKGKLRGLREQMQRNATKR